MHCIFPIFLKCSGQCTAFSPLIFFESALCQFVPGMMIGGGIIQGALKECKLILSGALIPKLISQRDQLGIGIKHSAQFRFDSKKK